MDGYSGHRRRSLAPNYRALCSPRSRASPGHLHLSRASDARHHVPDDSASRRSAQAPEPRVGSHECRPAGGFGHRSASGIRNRRFFSATIEADLGQTLRSHADRRDPHTRDLVFYLIDVDNFKEVNDQHGHDAGDKVLIELSKRLSSSIRHSDILVRWGGEEFLIVSRYTDRTEAELLAQRVLASVGETPFNVDAGAGSIYRTCSIGWASFPWFTENPRTVSYEEVLTIADRALNRAKQMGKNRAVGMLPSTGKQPSITLSGLHSTDLQVDVLAIVGPQRS